MLLAGADSAKETLECIPVNAAAVVRGPAEQGERLAHNRGVAFAITLPPASVPIQADPEALRRALLILMDNAAKYTPEGGSIRVGLEKRNGQAVTCVSDTGIGIAEADLPNIFRSILEGRQGQVPRAGVRRSGSFHCEVDRRAAWRYPRSSE